MIKRRRVAWLVAFAVGLTLVPAMDATAKQRSSAREQAQNHRITKLVGQTAAITQKVANLTGNVTSQATAIADLQTQAGKLDSRIAAIEAGVPQVLDGLTKLSAAATALKDGLTAAGAGLTKLGSAYQAVEYGRAGIFASNGTVAAGGTATSADIPDDGNPVTTGDNAIVVSQAAGAVGIDLRAAIRSAESDGDDAAKTAGQAGGFLYVVNLDTCVRVPCGGAPNPPGIFGTVPGDSIVTPSGTVNNLPLKNIPGGVLRTDTSKPDATSTSLLPAACQFGAGAAGITYEVHYSVNFLDIPTSTTPGPTE